MTNLLVRVFARYGKIIRFLISGGTALLVNLVVLYVLSDIFGIWYLSASVVAFVISFFVSFTLQKFWTFGDTSIPQIKKQMFGYLFIACCNLCLNTALLFILVDWVGVHYLFGQIMTSAVIAVGSYFTYQRFIFTNARAT